MSALGLLQPLLGDDLSRTPAPLLLVTKASFQRRAGGNLVHDAILAEVTTGAGERRGQATQQRRRDEVRMASQALPWAVSGTGTAWPGMVTHRPGEGKKQASRRQPAGGAGRAEPQPAAKSSMPWAEHNFPALVKAIRNRRDQFIQGLRLTAFGLPARALSGSILSAAPIKSWRDGLRPLLIRPPPLGARLENNTGPCFQGAGAERRSWGIGLMPIPQADSRGLISPAAPAKSRPDGLRPIYPPTTPRRPSVTQRRWTLAARLSLQAFGRQPPTGSTPGPASTTITWPVM